MIIVMNPGATQEELNAVVELVTGTGLKVHLSGRVPHDHWCNRREITDRLNYQ